MTTWTTRPIALVSLRDNSFATALVTVSVTTIVATVEYSYCIAFCSMKQNNKKRTKAWGETDATQGKFQRGKDQESREQEGKANHKRN